MVTGMDQLWKLVQVVYVSLTQRIIIRILSRLIMLTLIYCKAGEYDLILVTFLIVVYVTFLSALWLCIVNLLYLEGISFRADDKF